MRFSITCNFVYTRTSVLSLFIFTPGNVFAVQWRLFSTVEVAKYGGGLTSVQWRDNMIFVGG